MALMQNLLATAITAKAGSTCTADINGVETVVQVARELTVAAGDIIAVQRYGPTWVATGRLYAAAPIAPPSPKPPPTKPTTVTGKTTFSPYETRSYRPNYGWRDDTTDVYHGQYGGWGNHTGCAFYRGAPRSLDGSVVTAATIQVRRPSGTGGSYAAQPVTMRLMTNATRPGGAPTLTSSTTGPSIAAGATRTFTIPDSWGQALVDGSAGGLAFFDADGSPYTIFAGKGTWSPAFSLTISWRRTT